MSPPRIASANAAVALSGWRRTAVALVWLAILLSAVLVISRTQFSADLSAFLPASPDARQRVLTEQLQSGVASRTLFIGIEGGQDAKQRADVSRALGRGMRASGLFDQVQNGDHSDWEEAGTYVFDHRYQLAPDVRPERFTTEGLRDAIADTLSLLGTPAGNLIKPLLERDPTGETQRIAEGLIPANSPRTEEGVWVSREAPRAMLLAGTKAAGSDLDAQTAAMERVQTEFAKATEGMGAAAPKLLMSGAPVFSVSSRDQIKQEATHLAIVGGIVMGCLLMLAFASPRALVVAFLPVVTGVLCGTAAVSLVFGSVHGLTMGFGSTLIGETIDYAIYYMIQARGATVRGTGWIRWRDQNWPTVRLGLLTSVCGFAALLFSGFPGLAQLGVFSIAGLVAAAMAARHGLPALAPDGAAGMGMRRAMARIAALTLRALPRLRWVFVAAGIAAFGLLLWQGGHLWRGNLSSMSPVTQEANALDERLRGDIGASDARTLVVVQAPDIEGTLQAAEIAGDRLEALVNSGDLDGFETVTRMLPSVATQQKRLASLPDEATLRARLAEATAGGPLPASRLEPFLLEVEKARQLQPITYADMQANPLGAVVNALMYQRPGGGWAALISLHPGAKFDADRLSAALTGVPGVQVVDVKHELDSLYSRFLQEAIAQVALGALAVVLLLALSLRSWRRLIAVCLPLAWAVLLTLGGMALLGMALGILHLIGLLLIVAVGSNYALFFDQLQESGRADQDTLASLFLANLTTVVSFTLIGLSEIPALSAIGRVVAPGAFMALVLAAAFARQTRATVYDTTA